jgi:dihydroorotate dehydrogenase electron transfer subunit
LADQRLTLPTPFRVQSIHQENYRTKTLVLDGRLDAYPGQFVMAWLPRFDEKPFSLVNSDPITLMVTAVGPFSNLLHERCLGDPIWLRGPFGQGFRPSPVQSNLALVGGGYGVAPLLWLARSTPNANVTAYIGARTAADLLYADRFEALAHERRAQAGPVSVVLATEDGTAGQRGLITEALQSSLLAGAVDGIFACGPHGLLHALQSLAAPLGVPCQLSWEAYMRCGIGICGACEHEGKVLCLDGPVLTG